MYCRAKDGDGRLAPSQNLVDPRSTQTVETRSTGLLYNRSFLVVSPPVPGHPTKPLDRIYGFHVRRIATVSADHHKLPN